MSILLLIVVAAALGNWVFGRPERNSIEAQAYRLYAGLALCAVIVIGAGSVSLRWAQLALFMLAAVAIVIEARRLTEGDHRGRENRSDRDAFNPLEKFCIATLLLANLFALITALAPNTQWDAGVAHLALPSDYVRADRILLLEGNVYSAYPHLLHALYTFAYYQGGETSAALLNWLYGPLGCIALFGLGRRIENRQCGFVAAAMFATAPIFFDQTGAVSLDVPFAGMTIAAMACIAAWREDRKLSWLLLAACIAGSSAGVRHTGYLTCILLAIGVFLIGSPPRLKPFMLFAFVMAATAAPWLIRSAVAVGNPVYPFMSSLFPSAQMPDIQTTSMLSHESIQGKGITDFFMFPWNIVMRPNWYDGWAQSPGVLLFALGIPGLVVGGAKARWLGAFSIAGGLSFFFFQRFARYLFPFFVPMMVVAAIAAGRLPHLRRPIAALLVFTFCYGLTLGAAAVHFKVPAVIGLQTREAYLAKRVERYVAFEWANRNLSENAVVMTLDPRSYFIDRPTFQNFEVLAALGDLSNDDLMDWFEARNIRYIFYPKNYVKATPVFAERGFLRTLDRWRGDEDYFRLMHTQREPLRDGRGTERVEFYEIHYDGDGRLMQLEEVRKLHRNDNP